MVAGAISKSLTLDLATKERRKGCRMHSDGRCPRTVESARKVVGKNFYNAISHFYEICYLPHCVNAIAITLILKHYESIRKIFILFHGVIWGLSFSSGKPSCTIKVDEKAYDSVNEDVLFVLLTAIGTLLRGSFSYVELASLEFSVSSMLLKEHFRLEVSDGRWCRVWLDPWLQDEENIPKHSFYAWLAIKDRLGTKDRLLRWVMASSHRIGGWDIELSLVCCQGPPLVLTRILRIKNQVVRLVM
ncbi:uncharacterized protein E6C27_scaffold138G001020 [Cucumis melo var. makuwa]|uniref:Reverse transcriptase zinc-binding domain-containing protein n=1 Tax=Cucumis melo var. makuwa TaxID=1194695 RepID=A0A5A7VHX2_CUCMM|nr:uncharacterized protein E6C27_scaffold138G001020 [Cucumis melo var. makuwa]